MNTGKKWMLLSVVLVFICGIFAGILVEREFLHSHSDRGHGKKGHDSTDFVAKKFAKDLSLTVDQQKKVEEIFNKHKPEFEAIRKDVKSRMKPIFVEMDKEILSVLDEGQKAKFKEMMKKKRAQDKKNGEPPPPR